MHSHGATRQAFIMGACVFFFFTAWGATLGMFSELLLQREVMPPAPAALEPLPFRTSRADYFGGALKKDRSRAPVSQIEMVKAYPNDTLKAHQNSTRGSTQDSAAAQQDTAEGLAAEWLECAAARRPGTRNRGRHRPHTARHHHGALPSRPASIAPRPAALNAASAAVPPALAPAQVLCGGAGGCGPREHTRVGDAER